MNEDLPEFFDQIPPQPAPPALRTRVLAAVEGELSNRRKPRWERVLELSVAASFVLGVGLNAWEFAHGPLGSSIYEVESSDLRERLATMKADSVSTPEQTLPESFEAQYARYLARLTGRPLGG